MKKLCKNFILCGILGWCLEIAFTSFQSFRRREPRLTGQTSLWMFPIYGLACLLRPVYLLLKGCHWAVRGTAYMLCIFGAEYTAGRLLSAKERCPWDYASSSWNVNRLIRLDYAPCWFATGLLMEQIIKDPGIRRKQKKSGNHSRTLSV